MTFWTSWCPNCRTELASIARQRDEIDSAALDVIAVCIDRQSQPSTDATASTLQPVDFLRKIRFPYPAATTTRECLQAVLQLQKALFDQSPPFVIPLSVLLDSDRNLVAIYRGTVSVKELLEDVDHVNASPEKMRNLAVPFSGTWFTKAATRSQVAELVGRRLFSRYPHEALRYFEVAIQTTGDPRRQDQLRRRLAQMKRQLARKTP